MVDVSVLMPCYNEMSSIYGNILETVKTLKRNPKKSFELIVIDDGSSDKTFDEMQRAALTSNNVKVLRMERNNGKGGAIRQGFREAEGKYICFLDGDLDIHPRLIKLYIEYLEREKADAVVGSKRHELSVVKYPTHRKILSASYSYIIKMLFNMPVKDTQVGIKLFKREVLEDILPRVLGKKYAFDIEILANVHRKGYKIIEAPVEITLNLESSDVDISAFTRMFIDTCAIFYRTNILHYYDEDSEKIEKKYRSFMTATRIPYTILRKYGERPGVTPQSPSNRDSTEGKDPV